ncbi:hypothetical protein ECANGB1_59 [Enterospora canceri]|uniref:Uncharacterized protein n=1 Tax=Enterospora canceri TaxID=1081671 RepID=A0A1Y1S980_9MICR|nr:hypothetical protein ECANGB1_59 [Enterospora canceri]
MKSGEMKCRQNPPTEGNKEATEKKEAGQKPCLFIRRSARGSYALTKKVVVKTIEPVELTKYEKISHSETNSEERSNTSVSLDEQIQKMDERIKRDREEWMRQISEEMRKNNESDEPVTGDSPSDDGKQ